MGGLPELTGGNSAPELETYIRTRRPMMPAAETGRPTHASRCPNLRPIGAAFPVVRAAGRLVHALLRVRRGVPNAARNTK